MKFEMSGFDELTKRLSQMEKGAKELEKTKEVSFNELFTNSFMAKYTKFGSIQVFFDNSQFDASDAEAFKNIDETELDKYVVENSSFDSWHDILVKATEEYTSRKLGF